MRTRYYDDLLQQAAARGLRQAVLFGAGLDTRSFRLPLPADFHLFELDQGPLLEWKEQVLYAHDAQPNCRRSYVAADLREAWRTKLLASGFDTTKPTAFIAEGLLPYLQPAQQQALLDDIDELAEPGSVLALDRLLEDPHDGERAENLSRRSGIDVTQLLAGGENTTLAAHLRTRGWTVHERPVDDVAQDYACDLRNPFPSDESEPAGAPWLNTRFMLGTR